MKIAILSLPLDYNYGGTLQAYALQTVLERMGHDVTVLQKSWTNPLSKWQKPYIYTRRLLRKLLKDSSTTIFAEKKLLQEKRIIQKNTDIFRDEYLKIRSISYLSEVKPDDYDAIVVGSDQVWRRPYFASSWRTNIDDAFLRFTKGWNIKRIAYAASFGKDDVNEYSEKDLRNCSCYAQFFDALSVREDSGVIICNEKLHVNANHVLDPTMLLNKKDYELLIAKSGVPKSPGNLFCYILDETPFKIEMIERISEAHGFTPFKVSEPENKKNVPPEQKIRARVECWLRAFKDAEFVVTDSFHGTVFSIIFGKPFVVLSNSNRGLARVSSLLKLFKLNSALITDPAASIPQPYSVEQLNVILQEWRKQGFEFLASSLNSD